MQHCADGANGNVHSIPATIPLCITDINMDPAQETEILKRRDRIFTFAIPAFAFGGILISIALQDVDFVWGCVIASFLLGYFAYIKPRRDIVALCAPIYGVILFVIPGEIPHNLPLQVLFAVSITILVVRLNKRFGSLADAVGGTVMEKFLRDYIERIRPDIPGMPDKTAHRIASAFLSFKFGLFAKSAEECGLALKEIPDGKGAAALRKALQILAANAESLENSQPDAAGTIAFSGDEKSYCAVVIPDEKNEDPASLELDNAIIMVYAVAAIRSPDDAEALEEHRSYIIRILTSYKQALGIV